MVIDNKSNVHLGKLIKQRRLMKPLTLQELSDISGVSPSHLGRVERGERFPSAAILQRIASPLGFSENELFMLAGYLSSQTVEAEETHAPSSQKGLDPYVARMLAEEPPEIQQAVVGMLSIVKSISTSLTRKTVEP